MEGSRLFRTQCRFCVSCPHRPRTGTLNLATSHIACVLRIHLAPHRLAIHLIVERSEEHTSELQSLMRISYAVFCLKKKKDTHIQQTHNTAKRSLQNNT